MNIKITDMEWALGLYKYSSIPPSGEKFRVFYNFVVNAFTCIDAAPTYIAVEGDGYSGKALKFGSKIVNKLFRTNFEGITVLDLTTNPEGSESPAYDRFASASLSFNPPEETILCFTLNEGIEPFAGDFFLKIVNDLVSLTEWSLGLAFSDMVDRQPDYHILSVDNGKRNDNEQALLAAWYRARTEQKETMLRDVYPVMLLNKKQREYSLTCGSSVAQLFETRAHIIKSMYGDLVMYVFPEKELGLLRSELVGAGAVIMP